MDVFPLDPLLKQARRQKKHKSKQTTVLAERLLDVTPEIQSFTVTPVAKDAEENKNNQVINNVCVSLLGSCATDIEDHLSRFLPGSRQWIFDEYFR